MGKTTNRPNTHPILTRPRAARQIPPMTQRLDSADALAALVPDGAEVAIPKTPQSPTALAHALIRRGARDLRLVTVPTSGYAADILIGAGAVSSLETSGVTLGEFGPAPRFVAAVKSGAIALRDATCPAIYAAIQAGEKGQPFVPLRGLIGSDLMTARHDWKIIDNPFAADDPIALLPAIQPDIALIHAPLADIYGNIWVGGRHELKTIAHAARQTLATVEEIVDTDLRTDPTRAPNLIGPIYVNAIAEAKQGAWPEAAPGLYGQDEAALAAYAAAAKSDQGFADWLAAHVAPQRAAE